LAAIGLSGLWLADMAMGPMAQFDSRLYHFQAIKWARNYPVVPGLANLYGPLGFNNACFLYGALMQAGPWGVFAHHVTNSSLVYAMLVQCLLAGWKLLNGREDSNAFFDFCLLVPVVTLINKDIAGYTTDLPTTLTLLQAMSVLYCFLTSRDSSSMVSAYRVVNITVLVTLAVCFKFGSIVYAAGVWALVMGLWLRRSQATGSLKWRPVLWGALGTAGLGLLWAVRGIVLSGYPMFPAALGAMPVDWRAPLEHARGEYALIVHSTRGTVTRLGSIPDLDRISVWLPDWFLRRFIFVPFVALVPIWLTLIASMTFVMLATKNTRAADALRVDRTRTRRAGAGCLAPGGPCSPIFNVSVLERGRRGADSGCSRSGPVGTLACGPRSKVVCWRRPPDVRGPRNSTSHSR
jgi:hypothetical protein